MLLCDDVMDFERGNRALVEPGCDRRDQRVAGLADFHILGDRIMERLHRLLDISNRRQRRSRVLLNDWSVDGLLTIHYRVVIDNGFVVPG